MKLVVVVFIILCVVILIAATQASTPYSYYRGQPSRIPLEDSIRELELVKHAYETRTEEDIRFFWETDSNMEQKFLEILGDRESLASIRALIFNEQLTAYIMHHKRYFNRVRPYQLDKSIVPPQGTTSYLTPSYPAGHAAQAWFVARYFGEKYPDVKAKLEMLALRIDETRVKAGIHYPSDGLYGRVLADALLF